MSQYKIFLSYRRIGSADKAEHLLSLLEEAGYKNKVSFDRENFDGTFDLQILQRIDSCTDFILLVNENTFEGIDKDKSEDYIRYAQCSIQEFDVIQKKLLVEGKKIDFVRFEIARALEKKKNIIPIVPTATAGFDFDNLSLPNDINQIKRIQCIYYNNSKNFLFKTIVPSIVKRLLTQRYRRLKRFLGGLCLSLLLVGLVLVYYVNSCHQQLQKCRTSDDYEEFLQKRLPEDVRVKAMSCLKQIKTLSDANVYTNNSVYGHEKYNYPYTDSLMVVFSPDLSLNQLKTIRSLYDRMMYIKVGTFDMGSDEPVDIEGPRHKVHLTRNFYLSQYELTRKEWYILLYDSVVTERPDYPITAVSWNDISHFIDKLNRDYKMWKYHFALPTEAEWEYAAKANSSYRFAGSNDVKDIMDINAFKSQPVGQHRCNQFELYDLTGNVKEWCRDGAWRIYTNQTVTDPVYDVSNPKHMVRGGSYLTKDMKQLNICFRDTYSSQNGTEDIGFRLAIVEKDK